MQDAIANRWAPTVHRSAPHWESLRQLNHRFLDLVAAQGGAFAPDGWAPAARCGLSAGIVALMVPLSRSQRAAAAGCPYALFDFRFQDEDRWCESLQPALPGRIADEPVVDAERIDFVRLALFFAWHVASRAGLETQLLLGMSDRTVGALRHLTVDALPALALREAGNLTARWSECGAYWRALIGAAARSDDSTLRRVQLYGLQLAAAARLQPAPGS